MCAESRSSRGRKLNSVRVLKREQPALIIVVLVGTKRTTCRRGVAWRAGVSLCDRDKTRANGVKIESGFADLPAAVHALCRRARQRLQRNEVKTAIFTVLYHAREPRINVDHETLPQLRYNKKKRKKKTSLGNFRISLY